MKCTPKPDVLFRILGSCITQLHLGVNMRIFVIYNCLYERTPEPIQQPNYRHKVKSAHLNMATYFALQTYDNNKTQRFCQL